MADLVFWPSHRTSSVDVSPKLISLHWVKVLVCVVGCRYVAIVHPLKSRTWCSASRTNKVIVAVWVTSALLSSPLLYIMVALNLPRNLNVFWHRQLHAACIF